MIDLATVKAVVSQYEKFGWTLERILLQTEAPDVTSAFRDKPFFLSAQDALWFSRESGHGRAWELRRLTGTPFALVRVIGPDTTDQERDEILETVEAELALRDVKPNGENFNGK